MMCGIIIPTNVLVRKENHGHMKKRWPQTILILPPSHLLTGFFLGFLYIMRAHSVSRRRICFLLWTAHPFELTKFKRTPIIVFGALLAGKMTAWCSVIQLIIPWIVKEPSGIQQATVRVRCAFLFLSFPVCLCFLFHTILYWQNYFFEVDSHCPQFLGATHVNFTRLNKMGAMYEVSVHWKASEDRKKIWKNWDNRSVYGNQSLSEISVNAFYLLARWKQDCIHVCPGIFFFSVATGFHVFGVYF